MTDFERPLDGAAYGEWVAEGDRHLKVVRRSLTVFSWNMDELNEVLRAPESNPLLTLSLNDQGSARAQSYWAAVDQRLANGLASAIMLVDHTRPLTDFYAESAPTYIAEWGRRIDPIRTAPLTIFLRRFRNYLLHVGHAPLGFTITLGNLPNTTIQIDRDKLLESGDWTKTAREFLMEQPDKLPLADLVDEYTQGMAAVYAWLIPASIELRQDPVVLATLPRYSGSLDGIERSPSTG